MDWKRTQLSTGTRFTLGQYTVEQVAWRKPGFADTESRGWALKKDGRQQGPAHRTAKAAMAMVTVEGATPDDLKTDGTPVVLDGRLGVVTTGGRHMRPGAVYIHWWNGSNGLSVGYPLAGSEIPVGLERLCRV